MSTLTNEEYLALCQKLADQQYDDAVDDYDISKMEWIPAESETREKLLRANTVGMIDLTTVRSSEIKKQILLCTNLKVGKFKMRTSRTFDGLTEPTIENLTFSLEIWEEKNRTPNGMPCQMDFPMAPGKDTRFKGRPWLKYFNGSNASKVPYDTVVEIVRWMQAVKKLTAFL